MNLYEAVGELNWGKANAFSNMLSSAFCQKKLFTEESELKKNEDEDANFYPINHGYYAVICTLCNSLCINNIPQPHCISPKYIVWLLEEAEEFLYMTNKFINNK